MTRSRHLLRGVLTALTAAAIAAAAGSSGLQQPSPVVARAAAAATAASARPVPDFDIRSTLTTQRLAAPALPADLAGATMRWDPREGAPTALLRYGGSLTGPSGASPESIARGFLAAHPSLFRLGRHDLAGLVITAQSTTGDNGVTELAMGQVDAGHRVYGSSLLFTFDRTGRLVAVGGPSYPGLAAPAPASLPAATAVQIAMGRAGGETHGAPSQRGQTSGVTRFDNPVADPTHPEAAAITAEPVTFPMGLGQAPRAAWDVFGEVGDAGAYESLVDARSGQLLLRTNRLETIAAPPGTANRPLPPSGRAPAPVSAPRISSIAPAAAPNAAGPEGLVFTGTNPGSTPTTSQQVVSFAGSSSDPFGWVSATTTIGNNVTAYQDLKSVNAPGNTARARSQWVIGFQPVTPPQGDPTYQKFLSQFTNAWSTSQGTDPTTDAAAVVTQAFYYANVIHDHLYDLGFDEQNRNFQANNNGRGGNDQDAAFVETDVLRGECGLESACFWPIGVDGPPVDGRSPLYQFGDFKPMNCFPNPCTAYAQSALDADVVFHEYTHGVVFRLVGGGTFGTGPQTDGLQEGWGDAIATSMTGDPVMGAYTTGVTATGFRRVAYDTSFLQYADYHPEVDPHSNGEVWATVLWEIRSLMLQKAPADQQQQALHDYEQDVIDGMKNTPTSPSYLDARDGMLAADQLDHGGGNVCTMWKAFDDRGMGFHATSSADQRTIKATTGTDLPPGLTCS